MNLSGFRRKTDMASYTLIARVNAGNGRFPFLNVPFSKNHRPIAVPGATYYVRPTGGKRTPIRIGKDVSAAYTALIKMEDGERFDVAPTQLNRNSSNLRKTVEETGREYIERSKHKSHKTYLGYRNAVSLFVQNCAKTHFDEIRRDDVLDYLHALRTYVSPKTGQPLSDSTVFNYFLKTIVFLNDRGISKYVAREDWVQKKDWPVNVDKRNKNKKYATYTEEEVAAILKVADTMEEALTRFLVGTGFRIGEAAVAQWMDINWQNKTISVRFKPSLGFKPKDYEERTIVLSDTLLHCLNKYRSNAPDEAFIFPSSCASAHATRFLNKTSSLRIKCSASKLKKS